MTKDIEMRLVNTLIHKFAEAYGKIDGLSSDMFTDRTARSIYETILTLREEGDKIDEISVGRVAGISAYDLSMMFENYLVSVQHVESDVSNIIKAWQGREITKTLKIYSASNDDPAELTDEVMERLNDIINQTAGNIGEFKQDVDKWRDQYIAEFDGKKEVGLMCGYAFIDKLTRGYKPGNLIIIGARTGIGKTTFALNQIVSMARNKDSVGFISMEMSSQELIDKILGIYGDISTDDIHSARDRSTMNRVIDQSIKIEGLPIYINTPKTDDPTKIFNIVKQMVYKRGVKAVFIDYLQLMSYPQQSQNRNYEIGKITRRLKMLASEIEIPIIALSQLKRKDGNPPPVLSDLRDSGSIEQDANVVIFLHQPNEDEEGVFEVDLDCIVAKNRGGAKGFRSMLFRKNISGIYAKENF